MQLLHSTEISSYVELGGMNSRLPSSLNWLVDKRARLDHEVKHIRKVVKEANELLRELELALAAIDTALGLHEINIDKANIDPIRTTPRGDKLPYGSLTHCIVKVLKAAGGAPLTIQEITIGVFGHWRASWGPKPDAATLRQKVGYRLRNLLKDGSVNSPDVGKLKYRKKWVLIS
jgi:hypothetical protein